MAHRTGFGMFLATALLALVTACGGNGDDGGGGGSDGSGAQRLTSGDFAFEVTFLGAEPADGDVMRAGEAQQPPSGTEWWAFELRIKNVSDSSMQSANTPDVGVACGDEAAEDAQTMDNPGFIMGSPPYSTAMLDNGGSNTGVVPLAVPDGATNCRFIVRMDPIHDPDEPEILEFPFEVTS